MPSSHPINYILDTTVLLYDAQALFKFGSDNVIVPITVIEDIDHFKKDQSETGRNARQTSRYLDEMRQKNSVVKGIRLESRRHPVRPERQLRHAAADARRAPVRCAGQPDPRHRARCHAGGG